MSDRLDKLMKMHEADPEDADLPYMIAMEHVKTDDHASVVAWLDKTLALDAAYHYAYYQKAKALSGLGDDEQAITVLQQGLETARAAGHEKAVNELLELKATLEMM